MIPAGNVLAADTLNNSTFLKVVFKVVVSPSTVKLPFTKTSLNVDMPEAA